MEVFNSSNINLHYWTRRQQLSLHFCKSKLTFRLGITYKAQGASKYLKLIKNLNLLYGIAKKSSFSNNFFLFYPFKFTNSTLKKPKLNLNLINFYSFNKFFFNNFSNTKNYLDSFNIFVYNTRFDKLTNESILKSVNNKQSLTLTQLKFLNSITKLIYFLKLKY